MVRIALEATSICSAVHTGIQKYIVELLGAMAEIEAPDLDLTALYKLSHRQHAYRRVPGIESRWYVGNGLPVSRSFDVVHALDMRCPRVPGTRYITTVHDLAVFLPEHQFDAFSPERFRRRKRKQFDTLFARSEAVVAVSESTKRDIVEQFGYPEERVRVIYSGLTSRYRTAPDAAVCKAVLKTHGLIADQYYLFVGPPNERKNVDRIIDAFMMSEASKDGELILAGNPAHTSESVRMRLENRTISQKVRFIGYAKDDELPALYWNARAFVFPTLYEGFGLPILEALAYGIPTVIANRGAAPEVGGAHAVQVDPFSIESIAAGIDRAASDSGFDAEAARRWAYAFDWKRTAEEHFALYREVAEAERRAANRSGGVRPVRAGGARVWLAGGMDPAECVAIAAGDGERLSVSRKTEVVRVGDWAVRRSRVDGGAGPIRLTVQRRRNRRGLEAGLMLPRLGIEVPELAGLVEWSVAGVIWRHALVMRYLEGYHSIREHALMLRDQPDEEVRRFLSSLADAVVRLREARVYHSDLAYKNVLTPDGVHFCFIDLDAVQCRHDQTPEDRLRNAVQLVDSFSDIWPPETLRVLFDRLEVDEGDVWPMLARRIEKRSAFQSAVLSQSQLSDE